MDNINLLDLIKKISFNTATSITNDEINNIIEKAYFIETNNIQNNEIFNNSPINYYSFINMLLLKKRKEIGTESIIFSSNSIDGTFNLQPGETNSHSELILSIYNLPKCKLLIDNKFICIINNSINFEYPLNLFAMKNSKLEIFDLSNKKINNFSFVSLMTCNTNTHIKLKNHSSKKITFKLGKCKMMIYDNYITKVKY
jgi:hypothetical protein